MKNTAYRIKRTKLADDTIYDGNPEGHVSYLELRNSGGRKYNFSVNPCVCMHCGDQHQAIDFKSVTEAKKKLRSSAVKAYFASEIGWEHDGYRIEVVELHFAECDETNALIRLKEIKLRVPKGHHVVTRERVIWPTPPVLDRLAAIL